MSLSSVLFGWLDIHVSDRLRMYPGLPYIERVATVPDSIPVGKSVKLSTGEVVNQIPVSPGQVRYASWLIKPRP